jgi:hypothetical protein
MDMDGNMEIHNEDEYNKALARLMIGAQYISSSEFQKLPEWKQHEAHKRYDQITNAILKYNGVI